MGRLTPHFILWLTLSVTVVLSASQGRHAMGAGGLFHPPHGAYPMGWAGAVVAGDASLHAGWYNPALTAGLTQYTALVDLTLVQPLQRFTRSPRRDQFGRVTRYPTVQNETIPSVIPQFALGTGFGLDRWRFSLHGFAPNGVSAQYPEDGPQRYQLIDQRGSIMWMTSLNVAYRPWPSLWIGASLMNVSLSFRQSIMASAYPGFLGAPEDEEFDALAVATGSAWFNLTALLGVRIALGPLIVGGSFWAPTTLDIDRLRLRQRLPSHPIFDGAFVQGERARTQFSLPSISRLGIRFQREIWAIEVDGVYERHSSAQALTTIPEEISVRDVAGTLDFQVPTSVIPKRYRDTWSVRLGGEWRLSQGWSEGSWWRPSSLRLGGLYERGAPPDETVSLLSFDSDKWGGCFGATWTSGRLKIDLGYTALFLKDRTISESALRQINPLNQEGAIMIGAGAYSAQLHMLSVGMRLASASKEASR